MASPVNLRVAVQVPFPPLVVGGAPVAVTKANGIWTIALNVRGLAPSVPLTAAYSTDYVIVWDDVAGTYSKVSLATLGLGGARLQRATNAGPVVVAVTDQIINTSINASWTCALPASATRNGVPLVFKDAGGLCSAVNTGTITPNGAERIDGLANLVMKTKYARVQLTPYNDGTNSGWSLDA